MKFVILPATSGRRPILCLRLTHGPRGCRCRADAGKGASVPKLNEHKRLYRCRDVSPDSKPISGPKLRNKVFQFVHGRAQHPRSFQVVRKGANVISPTPRSRVSSPVGIVMRMFAARKNVSDSTNTIRGAISRSPKPVACSPGAVRPKYGAASKIPNRPSQTPVGMHFGFVLVERPAIGIIRVLVNEEGITVDLRRFNGERMHPRGARRTPVGIDKLTEHQIVKKALAGRRHPRIRPVVIRRQPPHPG